MKEKTRKYRPLIFGFLFTSVLAVLHPPLCRAQTINGTVFERRSRDPVKNVIIMVMAGRDSIYRITRTDSLGRFQCIGVNLDSFRIQTYRYGYAATHTGPLVFPEQGRLTVTLELNAVPILMDSVSICEEREKAYLQRMGFYTRGENRTGYFIWGEELLKIRANHFGQIVEHFPGIVYMRRGGSGRSGLFAMRYLHHNIPMVIFIDGALTISTDCIDLIPPDDILAVEVYKNSSLAPAVYNVRPGGVVLIWTKHEMQQK